MLRVMQLVGSLKPGGAEQFFLRLMVALHRRPQDLNLLPVVREGSWLAKELLKAGIPYETAPFGGLLDVQTRWRVARLAKTFRPDVIQSWMNRATRFVPRGPWVRVARLGGYYDMKYYRGRVDCMMGNTEDLVSYIVGEGWDAGKTTYLPNFIPEPPVGWSLAREKVRRDLHLPPEARVLMMAGRLHTVKGIDLALTAIVSIPQAYLLLLGVGPQEAELRQRAEALGIADRVRWVGWQSSLSSFASAADIWLAPSRHEPLGNVVLDAWAHAIPMIATRAVGPARLIRDGETGLLVPLENPKALEKAIRRLIDNPALALSIGQAGRAAFEKEFSEDVVVNKVLDYYRSIVKKDAHDE